MKRRGGSSVGVNVFIADASHLVCELMAKALKDSHQRITVVGLATDSAGVRKGLGENLADVALISADLGDGCNTGLQVVREVRITHPFMRTILLVDSDERSSVVEAFRARVDGIFKRDGPFEMLCKCIHAVHEGQIWANSKQLRFVIEILGKRDEQIKSATGRSLLTKREEELAYCVAEGLTNADISRQLNLSEHTVRNYLFRVFNKLGVSNRLELALYVIAQRETSHPRAPAASRALEFSGEATTTGQVPPRSAIVDVAFGSRVPTRLRLERQEG